MGKNTGEIYRKVCQIYHIPPKDTVVFEDAPHAIRSAKEAGCYVYAVPERSFEKDWTDIQEITDEVLSL
jgi:beta-phosphoglucomutase-like phosphatase (HAD superfamily)